MPGSLVQTATSSSGHDLGLGDPPGKYDAQEHGDDPRANIDLIKAPAWLITEGDWLIRRNSKRFVLEAKRIPQHCLS